MLDSELSIPPWDATCILRIGCLSLVIGPCQGGRAEPQEEPAREGALVGSITTAPLAQGGSKLLWSRAGPVSTQDTMRLSHPWSLPG